VNPSANFAGAKGSRKQPMAETDHSRTDNLARAFLAERRRAEKYLWAEMAKLGLRKEDGWSIRELTREDQGGTQIVLRPMHMFLRAPEGLECIVGIVEEDGTVSGRCHGPDGKPLEMD